MTQRTKRASTASAAPPAVCPRCDGYGLAIDAEGAAAPCDCGVYGDRAASLRLRLAGIPARFAGKTFRNFEAKTKAYRDVLDSARAYAEGFDRTYDGLLMRGRTGSGKTHLAVAILHEAIRRGYTGHYCNFSDLLARIRDTYGDGAGVSEGDLLAPIEQADLLVLDDLGAESTTDWVRDRLYLIVNRRYEGNRPAIITTNCSEEELDRRIGPRTASRLYEMCGITFPPFPDADWRRANLK